MIYHIKLEKGELWRPQELKQGRSYRVVNGVAWVTYTGVENDFVLSDGETLPKAKAGMIIEALEDLVLENCEP